MSSNEASSSRLGLSAAAGSNGNGVTDEDEAPRSIASLRSKFESLAAGGRGGSSSGAVFVRGSADIGTTRSRASSNGTDGGGIEKLAPPRPLSRPSTPVPRSPIPQLSSSPPSISALASATSHRPPPAIPPGRPNTPKPSTDFTTSAASSSPTPTISDHQTLQSGNSSTPLTSPALNSSTFPGSPNPARRAAPAIPSKPWAAAGPPVVSEDAGDDADSQPAQSVKALRERFSAPPSDEASTSRSALVAKSISADAPTRPLAPPMALKQVSAPTIKRTSTDGTTVDPLPLSPASDSVNGDSSISFKPPDKGVAAPLPRAPSPVPALSRSTSPVPPPLNRASKPPPRHSPSSTPPLSKESSGPAPAAVPPAPPQLPARRPTIQSSEAIDNAVSPPPIPINRPAISPALNLVASPPKDDGPVPPPLPNRSRANTVSRTEAEATSGQVTAPLPPRRLPARTATVPTSGPAGPPPPPAHPASPARSRLSSTDGLPPPPIRTAMAASPSKRSDTPAQNGDDSGGDDDDDVDDETAPISGLSGAAKRAMEDVPDSTNANRRPPNYVPDVKIHDSFNMSAFAVYGRHVCTGAHHVRVYDTLLGEHPIFVVDQRETGLEFRVKEPRITSLCFRPGATAAEEGRYVWAGTKDGHLWELDISTGKISHTRALAHASAVIHIFRHRKSILTLDDSGKLLVFDVGENEGQTPTLTRTLRIGDKFNFARMICGRLWTSSGPAARSTTSASSRGPTIRVYDPCAPGSMPPGKTLFTAEWTGAVTSATYMPLRPEAIYLGHEGGFISIWSAEDLTCLQVLKISSTDILALEGVGTRLWTGNRKGHIHVYDIVDRPWQTTNIWTAHMDSPVHMLAVDPWSIEHAGRYTVWSSSRDCIRAWDGLLAVDWIDNQMVAREPDYCTFRDINLLVCSWNIDSAKPTDLVGSEANSRFLDELFNSIDSPDIIVFGFQEVIPLTDKKLTAKTILFGGKNKDAGASADKVSHAYRQWTEKLQQAVRMAAPSDSPYVKVHSESLVGLLTCIFVKSSQKDALRDLDITTIKRGIGGIYGNKGAIVARMVVDDTSICFINVHLAAGQRQKASRNADLAAIMEEKAVLAAADEKPFLHGGDGTAILDHEMVILNGDLNYRIDQRRENVISSISAGELSYLLEHDQLRKEIRGNHAFRLRSFEEAPITFAPTYKYNPGSNEYDSSEKRRIPAWCDRILYKKCDKIHNINYRRYEPTVSDHKPISAGFQLTIKSVDPLRSMEVRREVVGEWAKKEEEMLCLVAEAFAKFM